MQEIGIVYLITKPHVDEQNITANNYSATLDWDA